MTTFGQGYRTTYGINNNLSNELSQATSATKANNMATIAQFAKIAMMLMG